MNDSTCAIEDLHDAFSRRLRAFVVARTKDDALADDIVQDAFVKLAEHCARGRSCKYPKSLLLSVAAHLLADHYRGRTPRAESLRPEHEEVAQPEQEALEKEWLECVLPLMEQLPEPYRNAVRLADIDQVPHVDIARRTGVSVSGVKSRVQRGRARLRDMLLRMCEIERDRRGGIMQCDPRR